MSVKNPAFAAAIASYGTSKQLARECGIHPVTISKILNYRVRPRESTVTAIAKVLNTTPKKLNLTARRCA